MDFLITYCPDAVRNCNRSSAFNCNTSTVVRPMARFANDHRAVTLKMFMPRLPPRMEQFGQLSCFRIVARDITSFVQIAVDARQCEIVEIIAPAVFPRKNMLDMQGGQWRLILMQSAILATEICPVANPASRGGVHAG